MANKSEIKTIRIACEGAGTIKIDELIPMQGELKVLSEESYQRLRMSIIELGFSFPVQAWKDKKKTYILDAHQRVATIKRMRDEEGYKIPPIPVSWVSAISRAEAAKKLLAAASQYGEVTYEGLHEFMKEFNIDMTKLMTEFQFPEINFTQFEQSFFPDEKTVSFTTKAGSKELGSEEFEDFQHKCPKCGFHFDEKS